MAQESKAPDLLAPSKLVLECPAASKPLLNRGDFLKEDWAVFSVQGSQIELVPIKEGELEFQVSCGSTDSENPKLLTGKQIVKKQETQNPQGHGPLLPERYSYHLWMWLVLFLALLLLALLILQILQKYKKRKLAKIGNRKISKVISPREAFEDLLKNVRIQRLFESEDVATIKDVYSRSYQCSRAILEETFKLENAFESTSEFLASFRLKAVAFSLPADSVKRIEALFLQADEVRFSGLIPDLGDRKQFQKFLDDVESVTRISRPHPPRSSK